MAEDSFYGTFLQHFGCVPTESQSVLFSELEKFIRDRDKKRIFIVKGYAGTGKTSVLSAFVKALHQFKVKTKLLAPTGRAAKVFSHKSETDAFTIHKHIYRRKSKVDITSGLDLQMNLFKNTVFFVDEASMIGDYTLLKDGQINPCLLYTSDAADE